MMVRLSLAFVSLALAGLASAAVQASEMDVAAFHRHILQLRKRSRQLRRAGPSAVADPGYKLVVSPYVSCPANPTGSGGLSSFTVFPPTVTNGNGLYLTCEYNTADSSANTACYYDANGDLVSAFTEATYCLQSSISDEGADKSNNSGNALDPNSGNTDAFITNDGAYIRLQCDFDQDDSVCQYDLGTGDPISSNYAACPGSAIDSGNSDEYLPPPPAQ